MRPPIGLDLEAVAEQWSSARKARIEPDVAAAESLIRNETDAVETELDVAGYLNQFARLLRSRRKLVQADALMRRARRVLAHDLNQLDGGFQD